MTAVCFAIYGAALTIAGRERWSAVVGLLGWLVMALGGAVLMGYAIGLPQTYRLGPWASMAVQQQADSFCSERPSSP